VAVTGGTQRRSQGTLIFRNHCYAAIFQKTMLCAIDARDRAVVP
jgi:hypothetical protein